MVMRKSLASFDWPIVSDFWTQHLAAVPAFNKKHNQRINAERTERVLKGTLKSFPRSQTWSREVRFIEYQDCQSIQIFTRD